MSSKTMPHHFINQSVNIVVLFYADDKYYSNKLLLFDGGIDMIKTDSNTAKHSLLLEERNKLTLGGVKEVVNFSDNSVSLKTTVGSLLIQGKSLNISRLNTDTGELFVSGEINNMRYSRTKGRGKLMEGLFK